MLLGDLITAVQERIPIKIAVFNNSCWVSPNSTVEGLLDAYTNLEKPDFAGVAQRVERAENLEGSPTGLPRQAGAARCRD